MAGGWRAEPRGAPDRPAGAGRRRALRTGGVLAAALAAWLAGGCGRAEVADTAPVTVAEGTAGDEPWRLEGRRVGGEPCLSLVLVRSGREAAGRCGIRRTQLRHLDPVLVPVGPRLLAFSPVPAAARRVRVDLADGTIRVDPARTAPGFPARFFVLDLDPANVPTSVRTFAEGGRAVVT